MVRRFGTSILALVACALAADQSRADPYRQGNLGGGFIELLMTGQTPSRRQGAPVSPAYPIARPQAAPVVHSTYPDHIAPGMSQIALRDLQAAPVMQHAVADPLLQGEPDSYVPAGRGPRRDRAPAPVQAGLDPQFERTEVSYTGSHAPGTIVIDTPNRYLYLVQPGRRALRYGIGVGRPGFEWAGVKTVSMKREWPDWRPPSEMLKRRPDLPHYMAGGPENPLGARAMYLGSSLYRIHGTNEPETIGRAVSSGCIRMRNEDVVDLYERVRVGSKVIVI